MRSFVCVLLLQVLQIISAQKPFAFTNVHGDNMVLQRFPNRAQVYGTSPTANDAVIVTLKNAEKVIQTVHTTVDANNSWFAQFDPQPASMNGETYTILAQSATNTSQTARLNNILFGDVYICSGQSNMQFTVDSAFNATAEVAAANNYPNIRLISVQQTSSAVPLNQVMGLKEPWSVASNVSVGGGNWSYFSAVCWFFGRNLYDELKIPLGLIGTNYGGTPVRSWMSADALKLCPNETQLTKVENKGVDVTVKGKNYDFTDVQDAQVSVHYNAMIVPFLPMTIKGAIWYQGESDANNQYASSYTCGFPEMINDWRAKWNYASDTDGDFSFGYVHLSTWGDTNNNTCGTNEGCLDVAIVRNAQSANYGYVPNPKQRNVYMATAIDLGDPGSPFGDIHPRYKQQVAKRLSDAALNMIYGKSEIYWQGPIADSVTMDSTSLTVNFRNVNEAGLVLNRLIGFEVFDKISSKWLYITPTNGNIQLSGLFDVTINYKSNNITTPSQLRYNWYQAPCMPAVGIYGCSVYDKQSNLPATPFIMNITS